MGSDIQKPRITELQVRMDCNGCVQKIKKALHGIHGIYEVYPDIARQKLTVIGWADPEKIVKAIRKTRKTVTICSHSEPPEEMAQPPEQQPETANPTPSETPPPAEAAAAPQPEAAAEPPKDQPAPETPQPEPTPAPAPADASVVQQPLQPSGPKDVGEVHVICHHPPDYGHRSGYVHSYGGGPCGTQYPTCHSQCSFYPNGHPFHREPPQQPQPSFVTHSYNTYKPSPYVTEYEYFRSPPRYSHYSRIDHYRDEYYSYSYSSSNSNGNGNISSMFSDENPNACSIM
ncbi:MLP423-like protein [Hibiscus syriacus]|uniref:MLP423-like protein n=1 Tax=Hibiscus syriacus TaxID=106335 RepID=A0A6A3CNE2_HIBSY|nr:proline-rich receptor-like protein kinase PERK8 [Hibiscus syriacus]KAE8730940.1 MLP423-like protein [Hibiscus syriacus]